MTATTTDTITALDKKSVYLVYAYLRPEVVLRHFLYRRGPLHVHAEEVPGKKIKAKRNRRNKKGGTKDQVPPKDTLENEHASTYITQWARDQADITEKNKIIVPWQYTPETQAHRHPVNKRMVQSRDINLLLDIRM